MARIRRRERRVGIVTDAAFISYAPPDRRIADRTAFPFPTPVPHPLQPIILERTLHLIDALGFREVSTAYSPKPATDAHLRTYHTQDYIDRVQEISRIGGSSGPGLIITPHAEPIARLAVGAGIAAVDAVLSGEMHHAIAIARPGGHHAMAEKGGFHSIYNSIVIAAFHARFAHRLSRIAIVDWDAHHGSGTQDAFEPDPETLVIDVHQEDLWPVGWGAVDHVGVGRARGRTVNIPLPAGTGNFGMLTALDSIIAPILREFAPELIIINAGQDGSVEDPLSRHSLTTAGYRAMTSAFRRLAEDICGGRLVILTEGGYSAHYTPYCHVAVVEGLCDGIGSPLPVDEPYGPRAEAMAPTRWLGLDARAALRNVMEVQRTWWSLDPHLLD